MNAPMPRRLWRAAMAAAVCVAGPAAFQPGRQTAMAATLTTSGRSASFACQGVHDFLVDGGQRTLDGANTFAHVCVQDGGTLLVDNALTLRTGALYVDATSRVTANGLPGNGECAAVGDSGSPGGGDGVALTVLAREAIILGTISDDGGAGVASDPSSCQSFGYSAVGGGGAGGAVMIEAAALTLGGTISALGGPGASAGKRHGAAGAAGRITIRVTHSSPGARDLRRYLRAGHNVAIATLTARQATALPAFVPEPVPSRITTLGAAPAQAPFPSPAVVSQLQQCGQSDLIVRGSMSLAGIHYYPHVCIEKNGSLRTPSRLTLQAQTILIAAGGSLSADEVVAPSSDGTGTGRYPGGAAPINRAAPPAGMPGASSPADGQAVTPPAGGAAGGVIVLIAHQILLAGTLTARGGDGAAGGDGAPDQPDNASSCAAPQNGAGGGSGGGVLVAARDVWITGRISVAGGSGGPGGAPCSTQAGAPNGDTGLPGDAGVVKLFADTLSLPSGPAAIVGRIVTGHTLPVDPVPPIIGVAHYYASATGHNLTGPFLSYWSAGGGTDIFGDPRTEAFQENGGLVQYTDRFLLQSVNGRVQVAPLGRALTAGQRFTPVAPFTSTAARVYFPRTGHSLSGQFLAWWQAHRGAALLGAPLSEVTVEGNGDGSGRRYPVQWFENGRLEYHAQFKGTRYEIELGLLGVQALRQRGWLAS